MSVDCDRGVASIPLFTDGIWSNLDEAHLRDSVLRTANYQVRNSGDTGLEDRSR